MSYKIEARCEHCGHKVDCKDDLERDFGWRKINGKTIPQAWCRRCRSSSNKKNPSNNF